MSALDDLPDKMGNSSLNSALDKLTRPATLSLGASVLAQTEGTPEERLTAALTQMVQSLKAPIEQLELPEPLEQRTVAELRAFADKHGIFWTYSMNKPGIISRLRYERGDRKFFS